MISSKKAVTEQQFHWMFIMIAGAIILMFFVTIVVKQKSVSESKIAMSVMSDIETVTTGASVSKGTAQTLNKPEYDLNFDCSYCLCKYSMKKSEKSLGRNIIFAPSKITGRRIISWTKDWNAPFRIVNFLFLTSPLAKYYLIYDSSGDTNLVKEINKSLPAKLDKEIVEVSDLAALEDGNYPTVKLIYLNTGSMAIEDHGQYFAGWDTLPEDITAVVINTAAPYDLGKATFYSLDPETNKFTIDKGSDRNGGTLDFIGTEAIYAAIFAHNYDQFACNLQKAYQKMSFICEIYINRTNLLYHSGSCGSIYLEAKAKLKQLRNKADEMSENVLGSLSSYETIRDKLEQFNRNLQINSCTPIY